MQGPFQPAYHCLDWVSAPRLDTEDNNKPEAIVQQSLDLSKGSVWAWERELHR